MGSEVDEPLSAEILDPDASGEWDEVRESWVDSDLTKLEPAGRSSQEPPPPRGRSSVPPPLPPPHVISLMLERLAAGDYAGTMIAARAALAVHPTNDDALQCRDMAASTLRELYASRLGMNEQTLRVPRVWPRYAGVLDRRHRTVFDLVDSRRWVEAICAASPLDELETLQLLSELTLMNAVYFL